MDLLEQLWMELLSFSIPPSPDEFDYEEDYTFFNVEDGEEGDYGNILYYYNANLVAVKTVFGGDDDDIDYTSYGKKLLGDKMLELVKSKIEKL